MIWSGKKISATGVFKTSFLLSLKTAKKLYSLLKKVFFFIADVLSLTKLQIPEEKKEVQKKKERVSKQKLLKSCHQCQNVTV